MNLSTAYLGLDLKSPLVVSACTLSESPENIEQMERSGAGAVVLYSLFEEQIRREELQYAQAQRATTDVFAEAASYFPDFDGALASDRYLELIRSAKQRVDMPVIASLNGVTAEGWIGFARDMADAGADAIELNIFHIAADTAMPGAEVEALHVDIARAVKQAVDVPVAIKLNPYFSATGHLALQLVDAGADGLVLFNRFYQPDIDIERLRLDSRLEYSSRQEIRLPLMWLAALQGRLDCSLAATTGVETADEVVKYLLAGADVVMTASSLYRNGIDYLRRLTRGLENWMERHEFEDPAAFRGVLSQQQVTDPSAYQRAQYLRILKRGRA